MKQSWMLVAATIISSPLFAQSDSSRTLDPVVITANKFEQKQSTTGKVIAVISKEQIERSAGKTLSQLLNEQAGVTIAGALNSPGSPLSLFTRGSATGRTLVLVDGIPVNDPSLINNEFDLNLLPLDNIERIEICKGAQSTLYGSDAIGGVVNIITAVADAKKPFNAKASLMRGNYGTVKADAQVYGKKNKVTYQAGYVKSYSDGFSDAHDAAGDQDFDKDGFNGDAVNAQISYQLTPRLSVKGFGRYSWYLTELDNTGFTDGMDFTSDNKNLASGAGFQYKNDQLSVTANYQYNDSRRLLFNDSLDSPGTLSSDDYAGRSHFVELYGNIRLGGAWSLLAGADCRYHRTLQNNFGTYPASSWGPAGSYSSRVDSTAGQKSAYASLIYAAPDQKLNIELGGRLNNHSRFGTNYTYTFNPSYAFNQHFRIFGSVATGFKAPSLYQLYSGSGNIELAAEKAFNLEAGLQQRHDKISNRVVYFYRHIKDGLDYNNNTFLYFNFLKQDVHGLEWETTLRPCENLQITGNYTWLEVKEQTQSREDFKDTSYNYALRRPTHSFNITIGYTVTPPLYISVSGKYNGKREDAGGYMAKDVALDAYFILSAYAGYEVNKSVKFFTNAQNITNKEFFDIYGYNSIPFLINGGVTIRL